MKPIPRVDVFVPCYNYGRYLRECVESITTQVDVEVRVLIINDASTDNSHEVATQLMSEDSRIAYIRHRKNTGHIATYNEALEWVKNEYTVLLSADDKLTPTSLARATRLMEANPQIGFVYGRNVRLKDGRPMREARTPYPDFNATIWNGLDWIDFALSDRKRFIDAPEVVVRTRMYKMFGGYRPELPHTADVELWLRLASHGDVGEIDADQAYYRLHDSNMHSTLAPSTLRSLEHWSAAFDAFFRHDGRQLENRAELQRAGFASLANMALLAVYAPTDERDRRAPEGLLDFAVRMSPPVKTARGTFSCGYTHGLVRDPRGIRRLFGAPAYLYRRLMVDTTRSVRAAVIGEVKGAAFALGRACAHATLIGGNWRATIAGRDVAPKRARRDVHFTRATIHPASETMSKRRTAVFYPSRG